MRRSIPLSCLNGNYKATSSGQLVYIAQRLGTGENSWPGSVQRQQHLPKGTSQVHQFKLYIYQCLAPASPQHSWSIMAWVWMLDCQICKVTEMVSHRPPLPHLCQKSLGEGKLKLSDHPTSNCPVLRTPSCNITKSMQKRVEHITLIQRINLLFP